MGLYFKSYINKDGDFQPIFQLITYKGVIYTEAETPCTCDNCQACGSTCPDKDQVVQICMNVCKEELWMLQLNNDTNLVATEDTEVYTENGVKKLKDIEFGEKVITIYPRETDTAITIAKALLSPQYVFTLKTLKGKAFVNNILIKTDG